MNEDEISREIFKQPLKIFRIYNAGNYERENLVLIAGEECTLSDVILFQMEYNEKDLPDYAKSHFLTFDCIELKAGDRVRIYTCKGEDREEKGINTGKNYHVIYWNLDAPVWKEHENEVKLQREADSYAALLNSKDA